MTDRPLLAKLALVGAMSLAGCSDPTQPPYYFVDDMNPSIPYDSFAQNPVTRDGKTLIRPAEGSIPRGYTPFHYGTGKEEAARAGLEVKNPLEPTAANLGRGQQLFETFCFPCHGKTGQGDGPVIGKFPAPPSLTAKNAKSYPDGRIFHVITKGQGLMQSYASQVLPEDRWRIIHYIRSMQGGTKGAAK